jgi:colanic acid/amylovoran biosynthesis protein
MVIGMRYHSNIFAAKMKVPFVAIAYEEKMRGFMVESGLSEYMITIDELDIENLLAKYRLLADNYMDVKNMLVNKNVLWKEKSGKTMDMLDTFMKEV